MSKPVVRAVGVGPANVGVKVGDTFTAQGSDLWAVGEELETWSGLVVRVTARENNPALRGAWRYSYALEVVGGVKILCQWWRNCSRIARLTRDHPILGAVPICAVCDAKVARLEASTPGIFHGPASSVSRLPMPKRGASDAG